MWRAAWHEFTADPCHRQAVGRVRRLLVGAPAVQLQVTQAHSLYLQTLAELGAVGLLLLLAALLPPLYFGWRYRGSPMTPLLLGAYAGFIVHNATDWDWSLPAMALFGLICGVALLPGGRGRGRVWSSAGMWRVGALRWPSSSCSSGSVRAAGQPRGNRQHVGRRREELALGRVAGRRPPPAGHRGSRMAGLRSAMPAWARATGPARRWPSGTPRGRFRRTGPRGTAWPVPPGRPVRRGAPPRAPGRPAGTVPDRLQTGAPERCVERRPDRREFLSEACKVSSPFRGTNSDKNSWGGRNGEH